jgi:predicted PurR-regulated permease PerM
MNTDVRPKWSTATKLTFVAVILVLFGWMIFRLKEALVPLTIACIAAYVLLPIVKRIQQKLKINRVLSIIVIYILLIALLAAALFTLLPILVDQIQLFSINIEIYLDQTRLFLEKDFEIFGLIIDGQEVWGRLIDTLENLLEPAFSITMDAVTILFSSLIWFIFIVMISIYLIKDSEKINHWTQGLIPPDYLEDFTRIQTELNQIWNAFFRGQLTLSLTVAIIITVSGLVLGLRFALLIGILAGLLEFFPSIGHAILIGIFSFAALVGGSTWIPIPNWGFLIIIVIFHFIFTQFDMNYLIPKIIGRSVCLPPLVVILGIIAGAYLFGVLGVVLAAPTIASLRVIGRYIYAMLLDMEPFPPIPITEPLPPPKQLHIKERIQKHKKK